MQRYNNYQKDTSALKRLLLEFVDFIKFKIENDLLTMDDVESVSRAVKENLPILGTADDFARFYNQSRTNVSSVINRRMIDKPLRRVYYKFNLFQRIVPDSWCHTKQPDG